MSDFYIKLIRQMLTKEMKRFSFWQMGPNGSTGTFLVILRFFLFWRFFVYFTFLFCIKFVEDFENISRILNTAWIWLKFYLIGTIKKINIKFEIIRNQNFGFSREINFFFLKCEIFLKMKFYFLKNILISLKIRNVDFWK